MHKKPIFFDAHTHPQFVGYNDERHEVIERAHTAGVKMIAVGTQLSTSEEAIGLAKMYPDEIWATAGFHPNHLVEDHRHGGASWYHDTMEQHEAIAEIFDTDRMRMLASSPEVVAIGECGLDYYRLETSDKRPSVERGSTEVSRPNVEQVTRTKKRQNEVFVEHIAIAKEIKKPLMIHCRAAFPDLINILVSCRMSLLPDAGIIHFFTGTIPDAKALLELGFSFTFGGVITFPPKAGRHAGDYDEVVRIIPPERILSETDSPYVAPVPYRGRRNEPAYVVEVVKKLAELKEMSVEAITEHIAENAKRIFKISF